jgi:quercetin dioxygenase-like cupin family protein
MRTDWTGATICRASDNGYRRITLIATRTVTHIAPAEGFPAMTPAGTVLLKVDGEATNGAYAVILAPVAPQAGTPGLHTHPFGESFYVLNGDFEFRTIGERGVETLRPAPGSLVHVPGNVPHTFKNAGATTGTLLVIGEPVLVEFFKALDSVMTPGAPPDFTKVGPVLAKYGVELLEQPNGR